MDVFPTYMQCTWGQKRQLDPVQLELQQAVSLPYGCWELSSDLEEQTVLLKAETPEKYFQFKYI